MSIIPYRTVNTSHGGIFESDLWHVTEEEILENLEEQIVIEGRRINNLPSIQTSIMLSNTNTVLACNTHF